MADPNRAAQIQLLLNPKLLQCNSFLQRRAGGAVYVCNVNDQDSSLPSSVTHISSLSFKVN